MNPTNLLIMIILISLLVLVHEWGHYMAARMFGVKVSKFGFGMPIGPTLYKTKKGDLEILVHACLLGGYVSFLEDDEETKDMLPLDSKERFRNQEVWKQAIIVSAGVIMNVVFAYFLIIFASSVFHKLPEGKNEVIVDSVLKDGYINKTRPNEIMPNDKILSVNGLEINSTYKFIFLVQKSKSDDGRADKAIVEKNLETLLKLNPSLDKNSTIPSGTKINLPETKKENKLIVNDFVAMGIEKYQDNEVELTSDEIKLRDEIRGRRTYVLTEESSALAIATALSDTYKPLDITLERNGKIVELTDVKVAPDGTLGVKLTANEIFVETKTPRDILYYSTRYMIKSTQLMYVGLWQLITGKIPASEMHGIIAITKIGSDIIQHRGMLNGLLLTAIISIDLAIINLLPIPALDGGHLMFLAVEKIIGRPLNEKVVENISKFFFALLIVLMILVVFNDIFALITKKF